MDSESLAGRRILIVEDEYLLADSLARALRKVGAIVVGPVPSVRVAFKVLSNEAELYGAVLDVNLGNEKVYPIADALAQRGIKYVFATGYNGSDLDPAYKTITRLEKPVNMKMLVQVLTS